MKKASLSGIVILCLVSLASAQTFLSEKDIKHPVKMPAGILSSLKKSKVVEQCVQSGDLKNANRLKASWFQVAKVNLNDDKSADYVVQGKKGCLDGPRAATFWVFKGSARGLIMSGRSAP